VTDDVRTCPGYHGTQAAPTLGNDYLCRQCVRRAERILGDLPSLARDVEITASRQDRVATGGSGHAPAQPRESKPGEEKVGLAIAERPLPVNFAADERARHPDVFGLLFEWADHVAAWHRVQGLPVFAASLPLTVTVPRAVAVLLRYADWMRLTEQGPDLAHALYTIRRELRRIVDKPPSRVYAGPCKARVAITDDDGAVIGAKRCELSLFRRWDSDSIVCDGYVPGEPLIPMLGCGKVHAATDRKDFLVDQVRMQLLPLKLVWESLYILLPNCQVDWPTAQQWTRARRIREEPAEPGKRPKVRVVPARLEPQRWLGDTPLYRGSDILRLADDKAPRRGRRRVQRVNVA
jgi:hypothetical protein